MQLTPLGASPTSGNLLEPKTLLEKANPTNALPQPSQTNSVHPFKVIKEVSKFVVESTAGIHRRRLASPP